MSGTEQPPTPVDPGRHGLAELIDERRAKAQRLRAHEGAFPYSFPGAEPIQAVLEGYAHLAVGEETEDAHRVAGASRRGAAPARRPSWISSIAPARSSCTRAWTCSARRACSGCCRLT